jgi:hypothetical protein
VEINRILKESTREEVNEGMEDMHREMEVVKRRKDK